MKSSQELNLGLLNTGSYQLSHCHWTSGIGAEDRVHRRSSILRLDLFKLG